MADTEKMGQLGSPPTGVANRAAGGSPALDNGASARREHTLVNGWNQAIGIVEKLHAGLTFAIAEMEAARKEHPSVFPRDELKAQKFHDAKTACDLAEKYLTAING